VYLVVDPNGPNERVLERSRAIAKIWKELGGLNSVLGWFVSTLRPLAEVGYSIVAKNRYRWYGKYEACPIPKPDQRNKFLDI
jgi:predicted DCC family thiol-disulfide oxidoreductase YuxK